MYQILPAGRANKDAVVNFIVSNWTSGDPVIVSKGKVYKIKDLPGFVSMEEGEILGVITFSISNGDLEIVTLDSKRENKGIATALLAEVIKKARLENCKRIWLVTTNDNTRAIRFYQKRGFDMKALYLNEVEKERKIKPGIPLTGNDGIPIKHEIEFEMLL